MFHCIFNQAKGKTNAIRLSCDTTDLNQGLSQQDILLNQINAINVDNGFDEFENQLQQSYQKFLIPLKRDLIHQMLSKSNGIIFNFQNI